jgi:hypothetical protein
MRQIAISPGPANSHFETNCFVTCLGGECLSLSDIDSIIQYDYRTEPLSTRQSRVMTAVGSLFTEGWRLSVAECVKARRGLQRLSTTLPLCDAMCPQSVGRATDSRRNRRAFGTASSEIGATWATERTSSSSRIRTGSSTTRTGAAAACSTR